MLIFQLVYSEFSENTDLASLRLFCVTALFNGFSVDALHKNNSLSCQGKYPIFFFYIFMFLLLLFLPVPFIHEAL